MAAEVGPLLSSRGGVQYEILGKDPELPVVVLEWEDGAPVWHVRRGVRHHVHIFKFCGLPSDVAEAAQRLRNQCPIPQFTLADLVHNDLGPDMYCTWKTYAVYPDEGFGVIALLAFWVEMVHGPQQRRITACEGVYEDIMRILERKRHQC